MLNQKKILFFSPKFFGYEDSILKKMESMGAEVVFFDERPFTSSYEKALLKVNPEIFAKKIERYFTNIFEQVKNIDFDYIFFLKCETPTVTVMDKFRSHFTGAKFCLYMWDSIKNVKNIEKKISYFDLVSSFDEKDSQENNFNFRPLFFSDIYRYPVDNVKNYTYDISSFGTIHSDRYMVISQVKDEAEKKHLRTYFFNFLQGNFMYYLYKITKNEFKYAKLTDFSFEKKSGEEITKIIMDSRAVLDIQHPNQTGLTMRTIEMLGMNKKIITTNQSISNYDFYHQDNISIIDRNNVEIDLDFLKKPYKKIEDTIYEKYSLEQWVLDTLGV